MPVTRVELVLARLTQQGVSTGSADEPIRAGPAGEHVVPRTPEENVVAIVPVAAVVSPEEDYAVVTPAPVRHVTGIRPAEVVVPGGALDDGEDGHGSRAGEAVLIGRGERDLDVARQLVGERDEARV